jgi:DNA polymerase III subunit gamma/tau
LKTLEEPPEHVKFIFCTTEPTKIPVTILSRCQRFDFAGIRQPSIVERLTQIVAAEGVEAESEALAILARRAAGSMRDSQSLLEQLLSFGGQKITTADVHAMLGTAGDARLSELVAHLAARDAAGAIADLDAAVREGVDVGQLLEQLLGYFRDCMTAALGCPAETFLHTSPSEHARMVEAGKQLGLETILAITKIIDHTLARLRYSTQGRTLAEMALVRIASLGDLDSLTDLIAQLRGAAPGDSAPPPARPGTSPARAVSHETSTSTSAAAKKKDDLGTPDLNGGAQTVDAPAARPTVELSEATASAVWESAVGRLSDLLADHCSLGESPRLVAPQRLAVSFRAKYNSCKTFCERPEQMARIESALAEVTGQAVKVEFALLEEDKPADVPARRGVSERQRMAQRAEHPMVRRAIELFDAQVVRVEEPDGGP